MQPSDVSDDTFTQFYITSKEDGKFRGTGITTLVIPLPDFVAYLHFLIKCSGPTMESYASTLSHPSIQT